MTFILTILPHPLNFLLLKKKKPNKKNSSKQTNKQTNLYIILNLACNRKCFVFRSFHDRHFTINSLIFPFLQEVLCRYFLLTQKQLQLHHGSSMTSSAHFSMAVVASTSALLLSHCCAPLRDAMTHTDYPAEIHIMLISHFSSCFL